MKIELTCSIVQDILPNYIEKLTSDESNLAIEEHLHSCKECKQIYEQMTADINRPVKIPVKELRFLKKVKKTRILAAVLSIILALLVSYLLYGSEYQYANDKEDLSVAITEFTSQSRNPIDAYVLETKEIDGVLVATFKDKQNSNINGAALLSKGLNQRYRIIRANIESSKYSSVIQTYQIEIKDQSYYVVSGYNLSDKIKYYGLDYNAYTSPGYLSKDRVRKVIKFDVKNQQFLEIYTVNELDSLFEKSVKNTLYNPILISSSLYDANGMEITDDFRLSENNTQVSNGIGKAELFLLYVYIALILGLGFIFARYFLTE